MQNSSIAYKTFSSQFQEIKQGSVNNHSFQQKALAVKKDKLSLLHSLCIGNQTFISQKNQNQLTLLHYSAYFNSTACLLYLLYKNSNMSSVDKQGKTIFHLCAYTGHADILKYTHQFWKLNKMKQLNNKFLDILSKIGFKRTDSKKGTLKIQVSKERISKFNKGQQQIARIYKQYRNDYLNFLFQTYEKIDNIHSRNSFHLVALNKYQKCLITLEYIIKSFNNQDLSIQNEIDFSAVEVSNLVDNFIDPRQYQDTLSIITEFILPQKLKQINLQQSLRIKQFILKILQSKDKSGHNPLYLASKSGSASIVALLKKLQVKSSKKQQGIAFNDQIIKIALNNSSRNQITDLCQASKNSDIQIINFLISCGQQVNKKKTVFGTFALLEAIKAFEKQKNMEAIKILLKSGADVNQQDSNGWTIFHHIAENGHVQILKQIFQQRDENRISKLNINKTTNKGYHPLHIAAMYDKKNIVEILLKEQNIKKYQIYQNPLDEQKATILHYAAKKGCLKTMKKILELKGKQLIGIKDVNDNTCLHVAAFNNHSDCVRELVYYDSDFDNLVRIKNKKGKLAKDLILNKRCFESIFTAARQGDVNMMRNLVNQKGEIKDEKTPIKKRTPLMLSVIEMKLVNVKFLVDMSADQYDEDADGKSASQYAVQLEEYLSKKDKSKIPLIKKIRSLLD